MPELWQLTSLIRSKNAGPFELTFDIIFKTRAGFDHALKADLLSVQNISRLYEIPVTDVRIFAVPRILAIKISIPRPVFSGDLDDTDIYGGQFHARLVQLMVEGTSHEDRSEVSVIKEE